MSANYDFGKKLVDFDTVGSRLIDFAKENLLVMLLGGVGLVLAGVGLWQYVVPEKPTVEIVSQEDEEEEKMVYVDIEGAVENPGVYELGAKARVGEVLVRAGGLASSADRNWVARFVNLASPVVDGMKIFIPAQGEDTSEMVAGAADASSAIVPGGEGQGTVNVNSASTTQLDSLWGIGEARARDIIDNRPYGAIEELMTKAGIPKNVYERIKDEVSLY